MYVIRPENDVLNQLMRDLSNLRTDKTYTVEIKQGEKKRTLQQNAYLHDLIGIICHYTGDDITDMKRTIAWRAGLREIFESPDGDIIEMPMRTSAMKTKECATFITACQLLCMELGLGFPDPNLRGLKI